ncbi:unnamed protein product [Nesidiocoris tenuis]|uniref:Uncharacterized protein n=1 Tax=Nesidiocoris tenuis TaxID=355587 RepID=A0A6H5H468_9HEMI|nr:unnamed protein product [Nesidiocoris tenuis]
MNSKRTRLDRWDVVVNWSWAGRRKGEKDRAAQDAREGQEDAELVLEPVQQTQPSSSWPAHESHHCTTAPLGQESVQLALLRVRAVASRPSSVPPPIGCRSRFVRKSYNINWDVKNRTDWRFFRPKTVSIREIVSFSRRKVLPRDLLGRVRVNDFLSGKAPLNLTMRLGDHMMLIQLQLSSVAPNGAGSSSGSSVKRSNNGGSASVATTSSIKSSSSVGSLSVPQVAVAAPAPLRHPTAIPSSSGGANPRTSTAGIVDCSCGGAAGASGASNLSVTSADATAASPATGKPVLDTKALVEASRNLTQTLKQLSSEVFTSKSSDLAEDASSLKRRQGAIIESMHHHGKGVYSGTFSGTLNPALQDRFGRPKRDISTIIHILNDLLCATPQYRAATHEPAKQSPPSSTISTATTASSSTSCSSESSLTSDHVAESDENRATRGKMERLRLVLGQRRERRRAMRAQPYPTGHDHVTA